jgi:hypothetical protein
MKKKRDNAGWFLAKGPLGEVFFEHSREFCAA